MGQCLDYTPKPYKRFKNWNYCHTHGGDVNNKHTSRMCAKPGPAHNPHATRTNMMNGLATGLHKTILLWPPAASPTSCASNILPPQQVGSSLCPPINFTTFMPQMMPPTPYHQMHYMGQQFVPTPPPVSQPAPPAPAPPAGTMMMPYYAPYSYPHPF
jgi:hypothetical protein